VPRNQMGALIVLDITAYEPVDVEVRFRRDFQLIWPAGLGAAYLNWDAKLRGFAFGEEQKKWFAVLGSPTAEQPTAEFENNYVLQPFSSFRLGRVEKGRAHKVIAVAASTKDVADLQATYQRLLEGYDASRQAASNEYSDYLKNTMSLILPDAELQRAYDWARVNVLQGVVANPFLGTGLVAGYRTSGTGTRPGFAWFFGRDALWTSFALNSAGDFATTRTALEFLMKYQRQDGKVEHEISQSAAQIPWFEVYSRYAFASADATPLLLIGVDDYVHASGDTAFVQTNWDHLVRAFQFLRSTWDEHGLPRNVGVGHGWIEGGLLLYPTPTLPLQPAFKTEMYQSGLGVEALRAFGDLAKLSGKSDAQPETDLFEQRRTQLNDVFWNPEKNAFIFAVDQQDKRLDVASVLTTVPMWFGLTDEQKTNATINQLADSDHATDWGMRIISEREPRFNPSGYHFGSVWPLFTGWAAVGEYRYHRPQAAYANLRANAMLTTTGSAGHATEVLSGAFFEPISTSSPHQIWSSAMIVSSLTRGMLGLNADAINHRLSLVPHLPSDWTSWRAVNLHMGSATLDLAYSYAADSMTLNVTNHGAQNASLLFSPAISPNAKVLGVRVNGRTVKYNVRKSLTDQHVDVDVPLDPSSTVVAIRVRDDFGLVVPAPVPVLGASSRSLKIVSEQWDSTNRAVTYEVAGLAGQQYDVSIHGSAHIAQVEGANMVPTNTGEILRVAIPAGEPGYQHVKFTIHFAASR
jgi:GH15 family glucan-1,4-alpha-glucosidase